MDEKKDQVITSDLRILVEGSEKRVYLKDKSGVEHRLNPLDISDVIEFEEELGISLFQIANSNLKMRHVLFLLYLSLRKSDCTLDDLERRKYKYTERQVQMMFDLKFLYSSSAVFMDLLAISGFTTGGEKNPPQIQPSQKATMPENVVSVEKV